MIREAHLNRAQWNALADDFETEVCDITREAVSDQLNRYIAQIRLPKRATLVDLGCGLGTFIHQYHSLFARITGAEFAPRIIARAKKQCAGVPNVSWLTMDMARSAKIIGTVADLTVCMNVITSPSASVRKGQWDAVTRVTKPGGFALIVVPSLESDVMVDTAMSPGREIAPAANGLVQRGEEFQKHYKRRELRDIFAVQGFAPARVGRVYYPWAKEGIRRPRAARVKAPWDWACLAQRCAA